MATVSINASSRTDFGKSAARKLRAAGQLPCVIYRNGEAATHIALNPHELEQAFRKTMNRNTLVALTVDGNTKTCLVRETQRDPVDKALKHVDFVELDLKDDVLVEVSVRAEGVAKGMTIGGKLQIIRRSVQVRCKPADIPDALIVDITDLELGDYVKVSEISAPKGSKIIASDDFNLLAIVGRRGGDLEDEAPVEEEVEAAEEETGE
jgi:large subunit ribosomal protein L25